MTVGFGQYVAPRRASRVHISSGTLNDEGLNKALCGVPFGDGAPLRPLENMPLCKTCDAALSRSYASKETPMPLLGGDGSTLRVRRVADVPTPVRAHPHDAGLDLTAAHDAEIPPGGRVMVGTGIAVAVPPGYVGLLFSRSGHGHKAGVSLSNSVGVIDSGYTGEIKASLINSGDQKVSISKGTRIVQLVVMPISLPDVELVEALDDTERGDGGFGSTGQ